MKRSFVFKWAKGYWGRGKNNYRITANRVDRALQFAYRDRRTKKRTNRTAWIQQINAASRQFGLPYSQFVAGLQRQHVALDRKMLATLAVAEPYSFQALANLSRLTSGIPWRDVNAHRLTLKAYEKYLPPELPPDWQEAMKAPPLSLEQAARERFAKAERHAEKVNAALIKSGKAVIKKPTPRPRKRPRQHPPTIPQSSEALRKDVHATSTKA